LDFAEQAVARIATIEADMIQVFSRIGSTEEVRAIETIIKCVRRAKRIKKDQAWKCVINQIGDYRRFLQAVDSAKHAGLIKESGDFLEE